MRPWWTDCDNKTVEMLHWRHTQWLLKRILNWCHPLIRQIKQQNHKQQTKQQKSHPIHQERNTHHMHFNNRAELHNTWPTGNGQCSMITRTYNCMQAELHKSKTSYSTWYTYTAIVCTRTTNAAAHTPITTGLTGTHWKSATCKWSSKNLKESRREIPLDRSLKKNFAEVEESWIKTN